MKKTLVIIIVIIALCLVAPIVSTSFATPNHGVISIAFDDGVQSQYDYAFPLMQARGIKATFYVITGRISDFSNNPSYMSIAELKTLQDYGCEIGSHSNTHPSFLSLSDAQIRDECSISKQILQSNGFTANNFAYPYGGTNDYIDSIVSQYYRSARSAYDPPYVMPLPTSQFRLTAFAGETGDSTALPQLKNMVDQVYSTNGWTIIFFHNTIPGVSGDSGAISTQEFASFLDYIISKGVQTLTVNQALDLGSPPVTPPSVTISPTSVRMYVGQSQTFSSSVSGGEPPYTYQWYLNNAAVSGANSISWTFTPTQAGFYNVYLNINDSLNNKAQSNIVNDIQVYNQYPLTMSTNYGTVSPSSGQYDVGSTISISATAPVAAVGESYVWLGWTGSGVGSYTGMNNPVSITMNGAITETASWTHQYYLTVSSPYGTKSGQGWYNSGATAYAGLNTGTVPGGTGTQCVFSGWSGDASGTSYAQSNGITMNAPRTATANWKTQYLVSFAVSPSGAGTTSPSGTNLWKDAGTLSISTTPNVGYTFSSWSSSTGSITFANANLASTAATISGAGTITANFNRDTYTITASTGSGGSISPSGAVTVSYGADQGFTITANAGYHISDVLVDGVSVGAVTSYTFSNVQADHTISASFAITTFTITFTESGLPSGTSWSVTFGSLTQSSTIATITFTGVTNGSCSWNALTPISGGAGIRYVASPLSGTMNVPGQTSQTITYAAQYYLTVASAYGSASGGGWYDAGASAYATVTPLTVAGSASVRYVFTSWSGDASGTNSQSNPIVMNAAATATANYKTQYYITVMSAHGSPRSSAWIDAGKDFSVSVTSPADIVPGDHRFVCTGYSVDGGALKIGTSYDFTDVEAAHTIVFNWKEQFWVVFQQTGLPDGVTANVVLNSPKHTLPYSDWFDQGLSLEFAYEDQLPSGFGTQYVLTSTSDSPPLKVGAPINVTGHYAMQYAIAMFGVIAIPVVLVVLVIGIILLRRRKKT